MNADGTITLFLGGGSYTVTDAAASPQVTKYYAVAGQRVALSGPDGLQYLLTDHLGSVSAVLDGSGTLVSEQRYLPFGGERPADGITQTDFGFTGQRDLAATGLMDYNARWYSQTVGVFPQPDRLPNFMNPQGLNRYAYVGNNPLNRTDPTGHYYDKPGDTCKVNPNACKRSYSYSDPTPPIQTTPSPTTTSTTSTTSGSIPSATQSPSNNKPDSADRDLKQQQPQTTPTPPPPYPVLNCTYSSNVACVPSVNSQYYEWRYTTFYVGSPLPKFDLYFKIITYGAGGVGSAYFLVPEPILLALAVNKVESGFAAVLDPARRDNFAIGQTLPEGGDLLLSLEEINLDLEEINEGTYVAGMYLYPVAQPIPTPP